MQSSQHPKGERTRQHLFVSLWTQRPSVSREYRTIYGGPQRLTITVPPPTPSGPTRQIRIDRTDGCGIARFDAALALLPTGAGQEDWIS